MEVCFQGALGHDKLGWMRASLPVLIIISSFETDLHKNIMQIFRFFSAEQNFITSLTLRRLEVFLFIFSESGQTAIFWKMIEP